MALVGFLQNKDAVGYVLERPSQRTLLHVVNCQGVMGSGIAKTVRERIPTAYTNYKIDESRGALKLGSLSWSDDYSVFNLAAQFNYNKKDEWQYRRLNYGALGQCLAMIQANWMFKTNSSGGQERELVIPYMMGSDRAGGDWEIVKEMLDFYLDCYTICSLKGGIKHV